MTFDPRLAVANPPTRPQAKAIELVERESAASGHSAAPPDYATRQGIAVERVGSARLMIIRKSRSLYLNRVVGLGVASPATEAQLDRILERYLAHGVKRFSLGHSPVIRPKSLTRWLEERGFEHRGVGSAKLWRGADPAAEPAERPTTDLTVEEIGPERAEAWHRIMSGTWRQFRTRGEWIQARVGRAGWHHYLAYEGTSPVACAAMFTKDGVAHLVDGVTLSSHRRRGAQSLLIDARVRSGLELGCTLLTSETAPPEPRTPLISYRNMRRAGFLLAYVRPSWVWDPP